MFVLNSSQVQSRTLRFCLVGVFISSVRSGRLDYKVIKVLPGTETTKEQRRSSQVLHNTENLLYNLQVQL